MSTLNPEGVDLLFLKARTHNGWLDKPVDDGLLRQVYDLTKMGPTSANMCPLRIVFVKSPEAKQKLGPAHDASNVAKTMAAPVAAILGMDVHFYEKLPGYGDASKLYPRLPRLPFEEACRFAGSRCYDSGCSSAVPLGTPHPLTASNPTTAL